MNDIGPKCIFFLLKNVRKCNVLGLIRTKPVQLKMRAVWTKIAAHQFKISLYSKTMKYRLDRKCHFPIWFKLVYKIKRRVLISMLQLGSCAWTKFKLGKSWAEGDRCTFLQQTSSLSVSLYICAARTKHMPNLPGVSDFLWTEILYARVIPKKQEIVIIK